jgi:hypothetical protein
LSDVWGEVCDILLSGPRELLEPGPHKLKDGREFYIFNTYYGDGTYQDNEGHEYFVDSGTIGCILADSVSLPIGGFRVVDMDDAYSYADGGILYFGKVVINTEFDDGDDDWDDYSD